MAEKTFERTPKDLIIGIAMTLCGGVLWGVNATVSKILMGTYHASPLWIACVRELAAGVLFLTCSAIMTPKLLTGALRDRKSYPRLLATAIICVLLVQVAYLESINWTNSGTATVLQSLNLLFVLGVVCLRGVVDMKALGENQIQIDCDVLQADGGTRTASITGAYVALVDAMRWAEQKHHIRSADRVLKDAVSAVSVGVINGTPMLDLPYIEDSQAMTDMNVAMTGSGDFIEIQGTAEHRPFNRAELNTLLDLAEKGNKELQAAQRAALSLD